VLSLALLFSPQLARAQFTQQGPKLVGAGVGDLTANSNQGRSVALSADGDTAIVGGNFDDHFNGAVWVFTRSSGAWTQQGGKLVGAGVIGAATQGESVALSADGNTAMTGGSIDNFLMGAAWVYTRSNGVWTQQAKLVGAGTIGNAALGASVALSADGNTALLGGPSDNSFMGAAWVYTRSDGVWTQQAKLVGAGAVGNADLGSAAALSADGNTALLGGPSDNSGIGAAWVFTRSSGVWTQQGDKLVGAGATGSAGQGSAAALSADGNTAIVAGEFDNTGVGAAWVYVRSGGVWTQQGGKLVGAGATADVTQGFSVTLSGDGNTAIVGRSSDNSLAGAAWVFTRSAGVWTEQGAKLVGAGATGGAGLGTSAALSADGKTAILGGPGDGFPGAAWVFVR
jgi:antibiotic biosynthesis monooxygenase (ABM) superfamily enzyme